MTEKYETGSPGVCLGFWWERCGEGGGGARGEPALSDKYSHMEGKIYVAARGSKFYSRHALLVAPVTPEDSRLLQLGVRYLETVTMQ
jgi:hypothetical protein